MIDLLPGASVDNTLALLDEACLKLGELNGPTPSGQTLLDRYRQWANQRARILGSALTAPTLDHLILSAGYSRLLQLSADRYGSGLAEVVNLEISGAQARLDAARIHLRREKERWSQWGRGAASIAVLDTNVLLRHGDRLPALNWHEPLETFPNEPVTLAIPLVVVSELDDLKMSNGKMEIDGVDVAVRTRVRAVHKLFDGWFAGSHTEALLRPHVPQQPKLSALTIKLMIDDLQHVRLPTADAEIIDRSLSLLPFAAKVAVATNDRAMRVQARFEGLDAFDPQLRTDDAAASVGDTAQ